MHEKTLGLFGLPEVGILPDIVHHVGDALHSLCQFHGQAMVFFVLDIRLDMHEAGHHYQAACMLHQLVLLLKTVN